MAYLSSIWVTDPNKNFLYKYTNDTLDGTAVTTDKNPFAICVSTNKTDVMVVNQDADTVSRYTSGQRMVDIKVGNYPFAVCQGLPDANGTIAYFVSNYADATVMKIVADTVVDVFPVGNGPRGLCCDPDGNIWVANYLDNTVSKIYGGNTLYKKVIDVASNPFGLVSDTKGNIYVTSSTSSVVAKIDPNGIKVADVNVGKLPYGICVDESGNVWTANYSGKSISKINTTDLSVKTYPSGAGPYAIDVDNSGHVIVFNFDDKTISKFDVETGVELDTLATTFNPSGFGDFTGMQAKIILDARDDIGPGGQKLIGWDDLTTELQNKLTGLDPIQVISKASNVTVSGHPQFQNVQQVIDYLLYSAPEITGFSVDSPAKGYAEVGSSIETVKLSWGINEESKDNVSQQTITSNNTNVSIGDVTPGLNTTTWTASTYKPDEEGYDPENPDKKKGITKDTTFTLTIKPTSGNDIKETATLKFLPKAYWGTTEGQVFDSDAILKLTNNQFIDSVSGLDYTLTMRFNASSINGRYLVFAIPSAFRVNSGSDIKVGTVGGEGGLLNSDWNVKQKFKLTNASGYANNYDVFTSNNKQTDDDIEVTVLLHTGDSDSTNDDNADVTPVPPTTK